MKNISEKNLLYILIALIIVFGFSFSNKLENRISDLNNQVRNLSSNLDDQNRQIDSLYSRVEELLKKQASIIDSAQMTYGDFDSENMTYEVTLTVTPKEYTEATQAAFTLANLQGDLSRSGSSFTGVLHVPVDVAGYPLVTFREGDASRSETLERYVNFQQNYLDRIKGGFGGEKRYHDKKMSYSGDIHIYFDLPKNTRSGPARLFAQRNGTEVYAEEIEIDPLSENRIEFTKEFDIDAGDEFILFVEIKDESGLTYRYPVDSFIISKDGHAQSEGYMPYECILLDKNGKEIKFD